MKKKKTKTGPFVKEANLLWSSIACAITSFIRATLLLMDSQTEMRALPLWLIIGASIFYTKHSIMFGRRIRCYTAPAYTLNIIRSVFSLSISIRKSWLNESFRLHIPKYFPNSWQNIGMNAFISIRFVCRFGWIGRITPNPCPQHVFSATAKAIRTCNKLPARTTKWKMNKAKRRAERGGKREKKQHFKRNKPNTDDFPFSWALRQCNNNIYAAWLIPNLLISICCDIQ